MNELQVLFPFVSSRNFAINFKPTHLVADRDGSDERQSMKYINAYLRPRDLTCPINDEGGGDCNKETKGAGVIACERVPKSVAV